MESDKLLSRQIEREIIAQYPNITYSHLLKNDKGGSITYHLFMSAPKKSSPHEIASIKKWLAIRLNQSEVQVYFNLNQ